MSERFKVFAEAPKEYFNLIPQAGVVHLLCEECPRSNAVWDMAIRDDGRVFFSACGEEGHKYTGSDSNFAVPEKITEENLADAMKKADRILSYRPTTVHRCVIECPLVHKER